MIDDTACGEDAWQVRVCGAGGSAAGAGVLPGRLHSAAVRTLQTGPCDLDAVRRAVDDYAAAIEERTRRDEGRARP